MGSRHPGLGLGTVLAMAAALGLGPLSCWNGLAENNDVGPAYTATAVALADLDGDGVADLASADGDGVVVRYQIPGHPGVFGPPVAYQP